MDILKYNLNNRSVASDVLEIAYIRDEVKIRYIVENAGASNLVRIEARIVGQSGWDLLLDITGTDNQVVDVSTYEEVRASVLTYDSLSNYIDIIGSSFDNVSIDAGGLVDSVNGQVGVVVIDASDIPSTPAGNLAATDVQGALNELQSDIDTRATDSDLQAHINEPVGAHAATAISYDDTITNYGVFTVQEIVDLLFQDEAATNTAIATHMTETVGAHAASAISVSPQSGISSIEVQAALEELSIEIQDHITDAVDAHDASAISNTPSGNLAATEVQAALNELQSDIDTRATDTDLQTHINETVGAHEATAISNTPAGTISSIEVQAAINELDGDIQAHINDAVDAHDASAISNIPSGNLAAIEVQAALNELQSDIDTRALDTDLQDHINEPVGAHAATAISNVPSGNLSATEVQAALNELQTDVDTRALDADVIKHDGSVAFTGDQSMGGFQLNNLADPTLDQDAATKAYVDNSVAGITGGDGITIAGNDISVDHDGEGLTFVATQLALELDGATLSKSATGLKLGDTSVTPGTYGSASETVTLTVDQQGRLTAASEQAILITASQVSDFNTAASAAAPVQSVNTQTGAVVLDSDDIAEGITNLYFTDERVDDRVADLIVAGTGITSVYSDVGNTLTISTTITQYTDEMAQDDIGTILTDSNTIDFTYTDGTPSITADVITQMSITSDASGIKLVNDATTPGVTKYYGTDSGGVRGFFSFATVGSAGDINEMSFSLANNQATPADVTGFLFPAGTVRSFSSLTSVEIDATADLFEQFTLQGINKAVTFDMSADSVGDVSGVVFSITSTGQVQYTSANYAGFVSGTIKFRAITTTV